MRLSSHSSCGRIPAVVERLSSQVFFRMRSSLVPHFLSPQVFSRMRFPLVPAFLSSQLFSRPRLSLVRDLLSSHVVSCLRSSLICQLFDPIYTLYSNLWQLFNCCLPSSSPKPIAFSNGKRREKPAGRSSAYQDGPSASLDNRCSFDRPNSPGYLLCPDCLRYLGCRYCTSLSHMSPKDGVIPLTMFISKTHAFNQDRNQCRATALEANKCEKPVSVLCSVHSVHPCRLQKSIKLSLFFYFFYFIILYNIADRDIQELNPFTLICKYLDG